MKKSLLGLILCLSLCLNSYGATVWQDNWENSDTGLSKFAETNGTATVSNDFAHSGLYSLKCDVTTDNGRAQLSVENFADAQNPICIRLFVYIPQAVFDDLDNENGNSVDLAYFYDSGWALNFLINIYYWDGFTINADYNDYGASLSASAPTPDTWNCIEINYYQHASAGYIYMYLNGVLIDSDVGVDTGANPTPIYYIGPDFSTNCKGMIYIDDIVWDNSNYVGTGYRIMQDGATGSPYHT